MARPKFIVDMNVGRIATWLRALGYDTRFENPIDDDELVDLARAEKRVVLTKDSGIMRRRAVAGGDVEAFLISGSKWRDWLRQVQRRYKLNRDLLFSRCLECNAVLEDADASGADPAGVVPERILRTESEFKFCAHCNQFLWKGGHWRRMVDVIDAAFRGEP